MMSNCERKSQVTSTVVVPTDMEDRLGNLPDEIICHILSLLPTRCAVRTSILSSRWKDMFQDVPNINSAIAKEKIVLKAIGLKGMICSLQADMGEVFKEEKALDKMYKHITEAMYHSSDALIVLLRLAQFQYEERRGRLGEAEEEAQDDEEYEDADGGDETASEESQDDNEEDEVGDSEEATSDDEDEDEED